MPTTAVAHHPTASPDDSTNRMKMPLFAWKAGSFAPAIFQKKKIKVFKRGALSSGALLDFAAKQRPVVLFNDELGDNATADLIFCGITNPLPVIIGPKPKNKSPETVWAVKSAAAKIGDRFIDLASSEGDIFRLYDVIYHSHAGQPASTSVEGLRGLPGIYDATIGLYSNNGRLDADKISDLFELSRREFGILVGVKHQTLHATPDSQKIQGKLIPFENVARSLALFKGDKKRFRAWLNSACDPFDGKTPMKMIRQGNIDVVVSLVEAALTGSPF